MKLGVMPVFPSVLIPPGYLSSGLLSPIPSSQLSEDLAQSQGGSKVGSPRALHSGKLLESCSDLAQILAKFLLCLESVSLSKLVIYV